MSQYDDGIDQRQYDDGANNADNTDYEYVRTKHFYNWNSLFDAVSLHPESKTKECANFKFEVKSSVK